MQQIEGIFQHSCKCSLRYNHYTFIFIYKTMATNAFYCSRCGQFTRHCSITMREFSALNGDSFRASRWPF